MMPNKNTTWVLRPALLLPGLLLAASCGSTPPMEEAAPELEATAAPIDEEQVELDELEQDLAEMRAALEAGQDADSSPEEVAESAAESEQLASAEQPSEDPSVTPGEAEATAPELADAELAEAEFVDGEAELADVMDEQAVEDEMTAVFNDPNEMFPVEMIDGVAFPSTSPFGMEEPQAEYLPEEPATEEEQIEEEQPEEEPTLEQEAAGDEPVEMVEEVTPEVLEDPVAMADDAEAFPVVSEDAVTAAEPTDEQATDEATEDLVAMVDDEVATEDEVVSTDSESVEGDVVTAATEELDDTELVTAVEDAEAFPQLEEDATLEVVQEPVVADSAEEALAGLFDEEPTAIELDVHAGPVADPDTDPADLFAAAEEATPVAEEELFEEPTEELVEEFVEATPEFEVAEELAEVAPEALDLPEGLPATNADALVWIDAPVEADALTPEIIDVGSLHAGLVEPATIATLPPSLSFLDDLGPAQRAIAAPLMLLDPTGFSSLLAFGGPDLASSAWVEVTKPEEIDPAIAALPGENRVDGSEFGPVQVEDKLRNEPGLGLIWWGDDVPFLHIDSTLEVQTPSVGRVRIVLESGDYVEGLLHAVGTGNYWVDGDLGRFAVDGKLVSHVERLPKPGLGAEVAGMQAGDLVRVKAASGYVEGRLVSMKGENVLIETADGMRITMSGDDVQPMGDSATRVVLP